LALFAILVAFYSVLTGIAELHVSAAITRVTQQRLPILGSTVQRAIRVAGSPATWRQGKIYILPGSRSASPRDWCNCFDSCCEIPLHKAAARQFRMPDVYFGRTIAVS
jgi:hypothetical protein